MRVLKALLALAFLSTGALAQGTLPRAPVFSTLALSNPTNPSIRLGATGNPTGMKNWQLYNENTAGTLVFSAANDAFSSFPQTLTLNRAGNVSATGFYGSGIGLSGVFVAPSLTKDFGADPSYTNDSTAAFTAAAAASSFFTVPPGHYKGAFPNLGSATMMTYGAAVMDATITPDGVGNFSSTGGVSFFKNLNSTFNNPAASMIDNTLSVSGYIPSNFIATSVAASQTAAGAQNLVINGSAASAGTATFGSATPKNIVVTSAGNDSAVTFTVYGTNPAGAGISEGVAGTNAGVSETNSVFATVTRVATSAATGGAVTVGSTIGQYERAAVLMNIEQNDPSMFNGLVTAAGSHDGVVLGLGAKCAATNPYCTISAINPAAIFGDPGNVTQGGHGSAMEIDVFNYDHHDATGYSNQGLWGKLGLIVVAFGDQRSSAAMQIQASGAGAGWYDGIQIYNNTISHNAINITDASGNTEFGVDGAGNVHLVGGRNFFFGGAGSGGPGTSGGEKIQLFGTDSARAVSDYSIGVESGSLWANSPGSFNWYNNGALVNSMSSAGVFNNAGVIPVRVRGMSFASANTDVAVTIPLPAGVSRWALVGTSGARLANASASLTAGTVGIFTGAGGTGQTIAATQAITVSATAADTNNNMQVITLTNAATEFYTDTTIYVRTGTAASGTGDIILYITPVS